MNALFWSLGIMAGIVAGYELYEEWQVRRTVKRAMDVVHAAADSIRANMRPGEPCNPCIHYETPKGVSVCLICRRPLP